MTPHLTRGEAVAMAAVITIGGYGLWELRDVVRFAVAVVAAALGAGA